MTQPARELVKRSPDGIFQASTLTHVANDSQLSSIGRKVGELEVRAEQRIVQEG
jgi:hypothetical protein